MGSQTSNFDLALPTIAGDNNNWGIELNSATVGIDGILFRESTGQLNYGADTGTANTIVATIGAPLTGYVAGLMVAIKLANTVTGPSTINLNGLGAVPFRHGDLTELSAYDALAAELVLVIYDGTQFQFVSFPTAGRVPVGTIIHYAGFVCPSGYLNCNGAAYSRTTFAALFNYLSIVATGCTITSGSATVSVPSAQFNQYLTGFYFSGPGVPAGATVLSVNATAYTYTLSANATATTNGTATTYANVYGMGDGVTTFNVPNYVDRTLVGAGNAYALGQLFGEASHTLVIGELPAHNHGIYDPQHSHGQYGQQYNVAGGAYAIVDSIPAVAYGNTMSAVTGITTQNAGSGAPHNNLQPSAGAYVAIKC